MQKYWFIKPVFGFNSFISRSKSKLQIESWERGTNKIIDTCIEAGVPEPVIQEFENGINVVFLKDIYNAGYLQKLGLTDRQIKAVIQTKKIGRITNRDYQELNKVSRNTASNDLAELVELKILITSKQKGAGSFYTLESIAQ